MAEQLEQLIIQKLSDIAGMQVEIRSHTATLVDIQKKLDHILTTQTQLMERMVANQEDHTRIHTRIDVLAADVETIDGDVHELGDRLRAQEGRCKYDEHGEVEKALQAIGKRLDKIERFIKIATNKWVLGALFVPGLLAIIVESVNHFETVAKLFKLVGG